MAPGEALEARITTGIAADGLASPSKRSSRFLSFSDWLEAHDTAYITLKEQFGLEMDAGPIMGKNDKPFPIAAGYIAFRDIDRPTQLVRRPLGEAYEAIKVSGQARTTTQGGRFSGLSGGGKEAQRGTVATMGRGF